VSTFHDVPETTWVHVANSRETLDNKCVMIKGASVEILGHDPEFGNLARYSLPVGELAGGTLCQNNALVFIPDVASSWPEKGSVQQQMADLESRKKAAIKRILGN
jgi:hypothetical protein